MKHISMIILTVLTVTLLATTQEAGALKQIQVTTETSVSQPSSMETSSYLRAVEFTSFPQAIREPRVGGNALITCKGKKDCGDLKKSGKCKAGTLKANNSKIDGKYYGDCVAK